jgi:flagellar secretion chaperone FliS
MNQFSDAKRAYTESSVLTAPPERLVVMLYDGAIRFLNQAATALRAGNSRIFLQRVQRAEAIIDELNMTLDMSRGGEVAERLRSIYTFCNLHLTTATMEGDAEKVDAVVRLLSELREAWQQIAAAPPRTPAAATA